MATDWDEYFMLAYEEALKSPDPSTQNGAVLVRDGIVIGVGHNHFPRGINPVHWHGEKAAKYARVVHAEVAAVIDAARDGMSTLDSALICPWAACSSCAKHIADAGVTRLVRNPYGATGAHWLDDCRIGDEIMAEAGIEVIEVPMLTPVHQIRRDGKLWP